MFRRTAGLVRTVAGNTATFTRRLTLDILRQGSTAGGGATTFVALTDTPANYTGQGGKYLAVNSGASAVEFVDAPTGGGGAPSGPPGRPSRTKTERLRPSCSPPMGLPTPPGPSNNTYSGYVPVYSNTEAAAAKIGYTVALNATPNTALDCRCLRLRPSVSPVPWGQGRSRLPTVAKQTIFEVFGCSRTWRNNAGQAPMPVRGITESSSPAFVDHAAGDTFRRSRLRS